MTDYEKLLRIYRATQKKPVYTEESELISDTRTFLELLPNARIVRAEAVTERGISDYLICYRGRFIAAELKDDVGTPSKPQLKFISEIKESGGIAGICRNLKDVLDLLLLTYK